jgi:hypothetical protein
MMKSRDPCPAVMARLFRAMTMMGQTAQPAHLPIS